MKAAASTATSSNSRHARLFAQNDPEDSPQQQADVGDNDNSISDADKRLSDILPPAVSFSRNSVLFSEKPVTQRNNDVLDFWRGLKNKVPAVVTGAWPWRDPFFADENPMGAIYNICFVRMPVIAVGLLYVKNLTEHHPLIMDYGNGPLEISPLIVLGVLALILA